MTDDVKRARLDLDLEEFMALLNGAMLGMALVVSPNMDKDQMFLLYSATTKAAEHIGAERWNALTYRLEAEQKRLWPDVRTGEATLSILARFAKQNVQ